VRQLKKRISRGVTDFDAARSKQSRFGEIRKSSVESADIAEQSSQKATKSTRSISYQQFPRKNIDND
jgi:hypothetical protein